MEFESYALRTRSSCTAELSNSFFQFLIICCWLAVFVSLGINMHIHIDVRVILDRSSQASHKLAGGFSTESRQQQSVIGRCNLPLSRRLRPHSSLGKSYCFCFCFDLLFNKLVALSLLLLLLPQTE